jgi:hypothetical protein
MTSVKPFGILVEAQGEGVLNRRDRAGSPTSHVIGIPITLPLMNTDKTDRSQDWDR